MMARYYIKKLRKQELGLTSDGSIARGRYIYISKACEEFFPHLSKTVTNDNVLIPIIPPFTDSKVYSTYVYHNDKFNTPGGTRDEYRLYLNHNLDPNRDYFKLDDIVVFEKVETKGVMPIYIVYRFQDDHSYYNALNELISLSPIKGGHALIEEYLPNISTRDINVEESDVIIPKEVLKEVIEQQEEALAVEDIGIEDIRGASLFGPDSFRDFVLHAYGYKCAITGTVIEYKKLNNLEAAHIQPKAHTGTFLPCNGIALSRDMHWAFDKGMITINDEYEIIVHDLVKNSPLNNYAGQKLIIPIDTYFQPERKFLKHHREKVFGLFLYSGSIRILKDLNN